MKEITQRQTEVLDFIASFIKENGFPPTVREIGTNFSISLRAVQDHIAALQKKGYLSQSQKRARSISVLVDTKKDEVSSIKIPLLSNIVSGNDLFNEKNVDGKITLTEPFARPGKLYFAVRVRGLSMKDAGILEGDIAVIEKNTVAVDGQIVLALVDGSVALRRFYKETDRIRLQPENADFQAIYSKSVEIVGTLTTVIRQY